MYLQKTSAIVDASKSNVCDQTGFFECFVDATFQFQLEMDTAGLSPKICTAFENYIARTNDCREDFCTNYVCEDDFLGFFVDMFDINVDNNVIASRHVVGACGLVDIDHCALDVVGTLGN